MKTMGGEEIYLHHLWPRALGGGELSDSRHNRLTPWEKATGTHCAGGWVGPRAGLDAVEKRVAPACNRILAIQPVARRYVDCTNPAPVQHPVF
jgi:hypothetical protein